MSRMRSIMISMKWVKDYVDLDGANLIANDIAFGSTIEKGKVLLSEKVGLGISLK